MFPIWLFPWRNPSRYRTRPNNWPFWSCNSESKILEKWSLAPPFSGSLWVKIHGLAGPQTYSQFLLVGLKPCSCLESRTRTKPFFNQISSRLWLWTSDFVHSEASERSCPTSYHKATTFVGTTQLNLLNGIRYSMDRLYRIRPRTRLRGSGYPHAAWPKVVRKFDGECASINRDLTNQYWWLIRKNGDLTSQNGDLTRRNGVDHYFDSLSTRLIKRYLSGMDVRHVQKLRRNRIRLEF